jgi:hypothetical protein
MRLRPRSPSRKPSRFALSLLLPAIFSPLASAETATWLNPVSGNWSDGSKWSTAPQHPYNGSPTPTSTYDVIIGASGAPYTVTLDIDLPIDSLTLDAPEATLNAARGRMRVNEINLNGGRMTLDHTTIIGATITASDTQNFDISRSSNELENVTLDLPGTLNVISGLLFSETVTLAGAGRISLSGGLSLKGGSSARLLGQGVITFDSETSSLNGSLTAPTIIGPNIAMQTGAGNGSISGGSPGIINQGLIWAKTPGRTIYLRGKWSNEGIIRLSAGELTLDGEFNRDTLGNFERTGGLVNLAGTYDNTGRTLELSPAMASWRLLRGSTLRGGTVTATGGESLIIGDAQSPSNWSDPAVLDGVTLATNISLGNGGALTLRSGLTLSNSAISIGATPSSTATRLQILDSLTIGGSGQITFDGSGDASRMLLSEGAKVTVGPGVTLATGTSGGTIANITNFGTPSELILQGLTWAKTPGATLTIAGKWSNTGTLRVTDGTLKLTGSFKTSDLANLQRTAPGVVMISGALDNTASTLAFSAETGLWAFSGANITGGTITATDGTYIDVGSGGLGISNSVLDADVVVRGTGGNGFGLANTTTFANRRITLINSRLGLDSVSGPFEVLLNGSPPIPNSIGSNSNAYTLGPGVTIRTGTNGAFIGTSTSGTITNQGSVFATTPGTTVTFNGGTIFNHGHLLVSNGAVMKITGLSGPINDASIGPGGRLELSGNYTLNQPLNLTSSAALVLAGTSSIAAPINAQDSTVDLSGVWSSSSTITATDSVVNIRSASNTPGSISLARSRLNIFAQMNSSAIGNISHVSSIVDLINSTLTNTNNTLTLSPSTLLLEMHAATITGGTINGSDGQIRVVSGNNTIRDVSIATNIVVETGASLTIDGTWNNSTGTITTTNANLTLGGVSVPTANWGTINRTGGTLTLIGSLNNNNATVNLNSLGDLVLRGTINRGTVSGSDSARLIATGTGGNIFGITLAAPLIIEPAAALRLSNTVTFGPGGRIVLTGAPTATPLTALQYDFLSNTTGTGDIIFDGATSNSQILPAFGSLSFPASLTIRTGTQGGTVRGDQITLNGTVLATAPGKTINIAPGRFTLGAAGLLKADGGTITIPSTTVLANLANGTLTNGRWEVYSGSTLQLLGASVTNNAANVLLSGAGSTFAAIDGIATNSGIFTITGGRDFTPIGGFTNSGTLGIGSGSSFNVRSTFSSTGSIGGAGSFHAFAPASINGPQNWLTGAEVVAHDNTITLSSNAGLPATTNAAATANLRLAVVEAAGQIILNADQDLSFIDVNFANANTQSLDLASPSAPGAFRAIRIYPTDLSSARSAIYSAIINANAPNSTTPTDGIFDSSVASHPNSLLGLAAVTDTHGDLHLLIRPTRIGDLNLDGSVSIADFLILSGNFGRTDAYWGEGDLNYDRAVTIADFLALSANFNSTYSGDSFPISDDHAAILANFAAQIGSPPAAVPEPSTVLPLLALSSLLLRRQRSSRYLFPKIPR